LKITLTRSSSISNLSTSRKIAAAGLFAALAILLTTISQALGLNFPIIPYLQFDFGEVAILLAFLLFGPVPAVFAAFVEFITLLIVGENVPVGPLLKLIAILSTIAGLWVGIAISKKVVHKPNGGTILGLGLIMALIFRAVIMTIPNYYLIVFISTLQGTVEFISSAFKLVGITLTPANGLAIILGFTALFNCLQLALAFGIAYLLLRAPQLRHSLRLSRMAWFETVGDTAQTKN